MTVTNTISREDYVGNGVQVDYTLPFQYLDADDVVAVVDGITMDQGADYNVTGDKTVPGSTLTFTVAPIDGAAITVKRVTPSTQTTEYTPYGPYQAEQIEQDLDKAILIDQEHDGDLSNKADTNHNHDDLYLRDAELAATFAPIVHTHAEYALASVQMLTGNANTLVIANPQLNNNVTFTPRTNIALGLAQLDASGYIPLSLLPPSSNTFLGGYDASGNVTPPAANDGEYYLIAQGGTINVTVDGITVNPVAVDVNDKIVWDSEAVGTGAWWLFVYSGGGVVASSVIFTPAGDLSSANVQLALEELDAEKSPATHFTNDAEIAQILHDGELVTYTKEGGLQVVPKAGSSFGEVNVLVVDSNIAQYVARNSAGAATLRLTSGGVAELRSTGAGGANDQAAYRYQNQGAATIPYAGATALSTTATGSKTSGTRHQVNSAVDFTTEAQVVNSIGGAALQVRNASGSMQIRQLSNAGSDEDAWIVGTRDGPVYLYSDGAEALRTATAAEKAANNSAALVVDAAGVLRPVGKNVMIEGVGAARAVVAADGGDSYRITSGPTMTVPAGLPAGFTMVIMNDSGAPVTLAQSGTTFNWFSGAGAILGNRTLADGAWITLNKRASGESFNIAGTGIT